MGQTSPTQLPCCCATSRKGVALWWFDTAARPQAGWFPGDSPTNDATNDVAPTVQICALLVCVILENTDCPTSSVASSSTTAITKSMGLKALGNFPLLESSMPHCFFSSFQMVRSIHLSISVIFSILLRTRALISVAATLPSTMMIKSTKASVMVWQY